MTYKPRVVKKSSIPERIKPLSEQGVTCYIDMCDSMFRYDSWAIKDKDTIYPLLEILSRVYTKFFSVYNYSAFTSQRVSRMLRSCTEFELDMIRKHLTSEYNDTTLLDLLLNVFDEDERVVVDREPVNFEVVEQISEILARIGREQLSELTLKECEHTWFKERAASINNNKTAYAISNNIAYKTNLVRLVNKYRDHLLLLPKRKPKGYTFDTDLHLYDERNSNKKNNVPAIDLLTIGFYSVDFAKKFLNEFVCIYKANQISINVINKTSDTISKGLSQRPYHVFLSKRKQSILNSIGFITPINYAISTEVGAINADSLNVALNDINTFVSTEYKKMKRITDKYELAEPLVCVNYRKAHMNYSYSRGNIIRDDNIKIIDLKNRLNSKLNKFTSSDITSTPDEIINLKQRENWCYQVEKNKFHFATLIVDVFIHIPIPVNVDVANYGRMLNAMKLTKAFDPDFMTLMVMPYVMDDATQEKLLELLDQIA